MDRLQKTEQYNKTHLPDWLFPLAALLVAFGISLFMRAFLPYNSVFQGEYIKLQGVDCYYYMRLIDNLLANFPRLMSFDPYFIFPEGYYTSSIPTFFAYLMAGIIKLLGGADPSQQVVDSIAVYIPAVMGALLVIPAFFIAQTLINRWAGLVAALITALIPGEFLARTMLGSTDHHVAELLFSSCFMMFFVLAIKHGNQYYSSVDKHEMPGNSRYMLYSAIAGFFMFLYLVTWQGALLFIFIVFLYFIVQFISDHLHGYSTDYLSKIAITCFLITLLMLLPFSQDKMTLLALAVIILVPIALNVISSVMTVKEVNRFYFPLIVIMLGAAGSLATWLIFPAVFKAIIGHLTLFNWNMSQNMVAETKPLFFPGGYFTFEIAWNQFALSFYTGLAGLVLLVYNSLRKGEAGHILVAVTSVILMLACFAMVRFAAYFAFFLAVLTGYLAGWAIEKALHIKSSAPAASSKKARKQKDKTNLAPAWRISSLLAIAAILLISLIPGTSGAVQAAKSTQLMPSNSWIKALAWMKDNTPEPFGKADYYYKLYKAPEGGKPYDYPDSAYGVLCWSDYGYWVTSIAHRIPIMNPGFPTRYEEYFTTSSKTISSNIINESGARYVIIDSRIASTNDKFYALATTQHLKESDFYELCWYQKDGKYKPQLVFYPEYYRSTVIRLYNFNGEQIVPQQTTVMSWRTQKTASGEPFKEILGVKNFNDYTEAEAFVKEQKSGNYRIIGTNPMYSPVPLDGYDRYKLVYQSDEKASVTESVSLPAIKIFEYSAPAR